VFPPLRDIYSFTRMTPLSNVKVVILGQDPYHGVNQAHGLCFSVKKPVPPPPSLVNIFKELKSDLNDFQIPKHGDLSEWSADGVLLLNASLTVRKGEANSHAKCGWMTFTDAIITHLNKSCSGLVFMLWGGFAQKKGSMISSVNFLK
jgi:uracil-DNA glycosylase